jgi:hypothetical protein
MLSIVLLLGGAAQVLAAEAVVLADVKRVLITGDDRWGGCMALLSVNPQQSLGSCAAGWVAFSCSGDFTEPLRAYRMLDNAQLALATGKKVQVWFEDTRRHNGYCFANRIDVVQ